jgi:ATP-dependent Clp protease ATP-binding subunit ClpC
MEKTIKFKDFFTEVKNGGLYQAYTPDGWQDIGDVYLKKNKKKYTVYTWDLEITTSEDHLFEIDSTFYEEGDEIFDRVELLDNNVWIRAKNIEKGDKIITENGIQSVLIVKKQKNGDTYDFEIKSDSHKYWSNKFCSHNSGKSTIAEGIALKIAQKKISRILWNKRIVCLDLGLLISGSKWRGQMEERVKSIMSEIEKDKDIILFIDEIHTIIGAGGASGSLDVSNMFKPALSRGDLQIIGATTLDEYRKYIEKDGALERRFQKVLVEPSSDEDTLIILSNIKSGYEKHHQVEYTPEALKACVDLTTRYVTDRFHPDKAIDALDESGSHVRISNISVPKNILDIEKELEKVKEEKLSVVKNQRFEDAAALRDKEKALNQHLDMLKNKWEYEQKDIRQLVNYEDVAHVISIMTGIPLNKITTKENTKLAKLAHNLKEHLVGQDAAIDRVAKSIQRSRLGIADPGRPNVLLFLGASGVGKTELAKQLAIELFDSEDTLIRLDMSEYSDSISMTKISSAPPGFVGYEEGSAFLNKVRTKPYSVILLDEIEKAHPDVWNMFLQVFEDGQMTDGHGRKINFKNSVIIMTSNVGARKVKDFGAGVGFTTKTKEDKKADIIKSELEKELKTKFPPEFINRIDDIIYFNELGEKELLVIIDFELNKLIKRIEKIGHTLIVDDTLKIHLTKVGYDPQYGARPMKRAIQRWVDDYLTDFILEKEPVLGTTLFLTYDKELDKTIVEVK